MSKHELFPRASGDPFFSQLLRKKDSKIGLTSDEWDRLELFEVGYEVNADTPLDTCNLLMEQLVRKRQFLKNRRALKPFRSVEDVPSEILDSLNQLD